MNHRRSITAPDLCSVANDLSPVAILRGAFREYRNTLDPTNATQPRQTSRRNWFSRSENARKPSQDRASRRAVERENALIAMANEEYERLEQAVRQAKAHGARARLPGGSKLNVKTADVLRVWIAIQGAFTGPFAIYGLASNELYKAMRAAIPGIPNSTMRSHLHRFKKKRTLVQIGFRWFLEEPVDGHRQPETNAQTSHGEVAH